jgi:hypothetical protein
MKISLYKIRHKTTGLFSSGGAHPRWTKKGKAWTNIGHIKTHFQGVPDHILRSTYKDAEIVEYEVTELNAREMTEIFDEIATAKIAKAKKIEAARKKATEDRERALLSSLQKKYGSNAK